MAKAYPYPPNVPKLLRAAFERNEKKYRKTARELGVNVGHVYKLIKNGVEPVDMDIRRALFLEKPTWLSRATDYLARLQEARHGKEKKVDPEGGPKSEGH